MPVIITNEPTADHGGIQRYVARLAAALAERGRNVTLVEPFESKALVQPGVRRVQFANGVTLRTFFSALVAYLRVADDRRDFTVASIWFPSGLVAAIVPARRRGRLAILAHGSEIAPSKKGLRHILMCWTYARADVVIANSRHTSSLLTDAGVRSKTVVVPCGVDDRPAPRRPSNEPRVLAVGRLIERKGFDRLIQAMPLILHSVPTARLRIVGSGPMGGRLNRMATDLRVSAHVDFLGALDDDALQSEYAQAWCFAMPCRRIGDDVEGFGIVYLEAAIAGLPSIGGISSGAEDAIADGVTGTLVDGDQVSEVASTVLAYLRDASLAAAMGDSARKRACSEFSWSRIASLVEAAVERAIKS